MVTTPTISLGHPEALTPFSVACSVRRGRWFWGVWHSKRAFCAGYPPFASGYAADAVTAESAAWNHEGSCRRDTPACLSVFGLSLPCTADDVKRAYRQKVREVHPDRGGAAADFIAVQQAYETALFMVGGAR